MLANTHKDDTSDEEFNLLVPHDDLNSEDEVIMPCARAVFLRDDVCAGCHRVLIRARSVQSALHCVLRPL